MSLIKLEPALRSEQEIQLPTQLENTFIGLPWANNYLPFTIYVNDCPPGPPEEANRVSGLLGSTVRAVTLLFIHRDAYAIE